MRISDKTYSSADAKQSFGQMIDDAQHNPITITKHNRDIAVVISAEKLKALGRFVLNQHFLDLVESNELTVFEAIERQTTLETNIQQALAEHQRGESKIADEAFFDGIKQQAMTKNQ